MTMPAENVRELTAPPIASSNALTPMDMLSRAVDRGADLDMIEKLLDLQERWETNQARKAFDAAISEAKAQIPPIERTGKGHNDKRYADFAAYARAVDPIITKYGLSYRFRTTQADRITVTCILAHKAGHFEENDLSGPADTSGSKNAIQAIGSTLTYLQRYSLIQALGLSASNDDDGKGAASGPSITDDQADNIRELLEAHGKDRAKFLKWAKVDRIEDLRADYYDACVAAIQAPVRK
jgi:hypothetical protein